MSRTLRLSTLVLAVVTASCLGGQAFAQAQTGTGGGPGSTITAPNTSRVGQTMPPAGTAGAATANDRETRTRTEKEDDRIMRGICIGCSPK